MNSQPSFSLKLLGSPSILDSSGAPLGGQAAQRHRIALLALLARSPERGVSREKLLAYLWPESGPEQARNLLNVSVYVLRKALGEDAFLSSVDPLRLNPELIRADVAELDAALQQGEYERAITSYEGPFLDGFFLGSAPELERWVDSERDRLAGSYAKALEELAAAAEARGDPETAVGWWKRRAAYDPYDSRVARRLMQMYDAAGNPAAALQHATIHERLLHDEFGVRPDRETRAVVEAIRQRQDSAEPYDEARRLPGSWRGPQRFWRSSSTAATPKHTRSWGCTSMRTNGMRRRRSASSGKRSRSIRAIPRHASGTAICSARRVASMRQWSRSREPSSWIRSFRL